LTRKLSDGKAVVVVAPSGGVTQGVWYDISGFMGLCTADALATYDTSLEVALYEYETTQVHTGDTFAVGDAVYWDATADEFTSTVGTNHLIGKATAVKGASDTVLTFKRTTLDS